MSDSQFSTMMTSLNDIMKSLHVPGELLFSKIAGSHSHNTNVPESDIDAIGIYRAAIDDVLGLDPPPDTITNSTNDFTVHEVGKFCRLLLKGNPGIFEMLYTDKMAYLTTAWVVLIEMRDKFMTRRVVKQYLGYLNAQLLKPEKGTRLHTTGGDYNLKWAYHMLRLGGEATKLVRGEPPNVWCEGHERDVLMKVRAGKWSKAQVIAAAKRMIDYVESQKPWPLPEEGDRELLQNWLLGVRHGEFDR